MTSQKLLYRSARVPQGRTAAALNLTPRALGWDRIHFAVRHLAKGSSMTCHLLLLKPYHRRVEQELHDR